MELILADSDLKDIKRVFNAAADFELGDENNYEIKIRREEWDKNYTFGNVFYIPGSEYGGIIGEINTDTTLDTISL